MVETEFLFLIEGVVKIQLSRHLSLFRLELKNTLKVMKRGILRNLLSDSLHGLAGDVYTAILILTKTSGCNLIRQGQLPGWLISVAKGA